MKENLVASVLSRETLRLGTEAILDGLRSRLGANADITGIPIKDSGGHLFKVEGVEIVVVLVGSPIPSEMFAPDDLGIEDAKGRLVDHVDHAMISAFRAAVGHEDTLRASLLMLQVANVICDAPGASAVFWQIAKTLTAAATFRSLLDPAAGLPLSVLVRFVFFQSSAVESEPPSIGIAGFGIRRFIGRDIEFEPRSIPAEVLADRAFSIAEWLIQKGLVFNDGDTCGLSETETIRVSYREVGMALKQPVVSFGIEHLEPAR